jgi:hypothetical protein
MDPQTKTLGMLISGLFVILFVCGILGWVIYLIVQSFTGNAPVAPDAPSPATRVCISSPGFVWGQTPAPPDFKLEAPSGMKIGSITFASLGTATGTCGSYTSGCELVPDDDVGVVINGACVGETKCTIPLNSKTFASPISSPCAGNPVYMTVQLNAVSSNAIAVPTPQGV